MPFILEVAVGGIAFSFLSSLAIVARESQKPKTPYENWIAEADKMSVVPVREHTRTF